MANDKRKYNKGRIPKWGEPKQPFPVRLTKTAIRWIQNNGGADFLEGLARNQCSTEINQEYFD